MLISFSSRLFKNVLVLNSCWFHFLALLPLLWLLGFLHLHMCQDCRSSAAVVQKVKSPAATGIPTVPNGWSNCERWVSNSYKSWRFLIQQNLRSQILRNLKNENGDLMVNPHLTGGEIHHQISESLNMHDISHRMLFYILSSSLVDSNWRWFPDLECIPSPLAIHLSSSEQKGDKGQGMGGKFFELKSRKYRVQGR